MQIQRVQTGGATNSAAGQVKRGAPAPERVPAEKSAEKVEAKRADGDPARPARDVASTVSGRLAAYADRIDGRLAQVMEGRDLSPRQRAALEQAQAHFHSMMQRLDAAYADGATPRKQPIAAALQQLLDQFAHTVNHIQSGGQLVQSGDDAGLGPVDDRQIDVRG